MPDTDKLITIERLQDLLAAYGARPGVWPAEERAAAQALIDTSADARALYDEERTLDALLQQVAEPEVSAALHSRVRSIAPPATPAPAVGILTQLAGWLRPQSQMAWRGAVATAGILGVVTGVGLSALVFDGNTTPGPDTVVAFGNDVDADGTTGPALASPSAANVTYSLTGEVVAEPETVAEEADNGEGTFTVAGIPLY